MSILFLTIGLTLYSTPQTVVLNKKDISFNPKNAIEVLEMPYNSDFRSILNKEFTPLPLIKRPFRPQQDYWAKYKFKCDDPGEYYFYFGKGEYITAYVERQDGAIDKKEIGEFTKRSEADVADISKSAKIHFKKGEEATVYVQLRNETNFPPRINLSIQNAEEFQHEMLFKRLGIQAIFHSAIWMMIFYTLFLWISIQDRAYLYYAFYMAVLSAAFFLHDQIHYHIFTLLAEYPQEMHFLEIAAAQMSMVLYFLFMKKLIDTKKLVPFLNTVTTWWMIIKTLLLPILIYINTYLILGDALLNYVFLIDFGFLFITCIALLFKKDRVATYFAIGSIFLSVMGLLTILGVIGFFDISWSEHLVQMGILGQIIFFSMGLGYKTRRDANLVFELQKKNEDLVGKLRKKVNEQEKTLRLFMRYVPEPVVAKALNKSEESMFDGELRYVTTVFCDVRGFTTISEELGPQEVVGFLNDFYSTMTVVIKKYGGSVNQFIGDEIFAVFGAPLSTSNNEQRAVLSALEMLEKVSYLNEKYQPRFRRPIQIGIGMNAGEVVAGNLGSEEKMGYSVSGDTVNTAKRIEGLTKEQPNSIVISETVYNKVSSIVDVEEMETVDLKGKKERIKTYKVIGKK